MRQPNYDEIQDFFNKKVQRLDNNNRRVRREKKYSLSAIFEEVKKRFRENNISINEICDNAKVSRDIVEILWSESLIDDISRIIQLAKVKITVSNAWDMKIYRVKESKDAIKVTRIIEPKCHIYYDKASTNFYNFYIKDNENALNDHKVYIKEMAEVVIERLSL
jgi:hypothetical protein